MSGNLEEKSNKEFKSRLKRGIAIAGFFILFSAGTIIYGLNNKFKPHIQKFSDFIRIDKKYSDNK